MSLASRAMDYLGFQRYTDDEDDAYQADLDYIADEELDQPAPVHDLFDSPAPVPEPEPEPKPDLSRIAPEHPKSFSDAKRIGEYFRKDIPVIMELSGMSDADARRMVDFAAGLVFALRGRMDRVTERVFLLSPAHIRVSDSTSKVEHLSFDRD